jgi:hypothetical protein
MKSFATPRAAGMLRILALGLCVGALVSARAGAAAELDASTGLLASTDPNAIMIGFEDADQLATLGIALTRYQVSGSGWGATATLVFVDDGGPAMTAAELGAHAAPDPAVEGTRALLLGAKAADGAAGVLLPGSALTSLVTTPRIQVTVWVRSDGATPTLMATYSTDAPPAGGDFTTVTAIRTGRETSDGWAELTTGPIDTSIWGVPLAQLYVGLADADALQSASASLVIDALEIAPVAGAAFAASACTTPTQDVDCGPDAECQFGHCFPAYASWGPTPSAAHRAEFVDRWIAIAKHIHGARNAAVNGAAIEDARDALVATTIGGREFYATMIGLVNGLRNHHTSFGDPAGSASLMQPVAAGYSSGAIGACMGFGELDLLQDPGEQRLGFIVYKVAAGTSVAGVPLRVGDAVTAIDGIDPLTWVKRVFITWGSSVPADPGADLAWAATSVAWMISHRASSFEITRCASATDCTGANRSVIQIDVGGPTWANLQGTGHVGYEDDPNLLDCAERFHDALTNLPAGGGWQDSVTTQTIWGDTLGVQFDGTFADLTTWEHQVVPAFPSGSPPTKVLFDVRQGNGGYAENSEIIAEEIRATTQPVGEIDFPTATWDRSETVAGLMAIVNAASPSCERMNAEMGAESAPCDLILVEYFLGDYYLQAHAMESSITSFTPAGLGARVAWLQAADVSANDYLAAFVEGRDNQRIFGPGPTSGSYGTISSIAPLLLGWYGGSIQVTDSVWGASPSDLATKPFHSGVGISPDVIVAQKMSDAINDVDTMLAAARAWLEE